MSISVDTALDMALAATKALRDEIAAHEETKLQLKEVPVDADDELTEADWAWGQSAHLQEKVDMLEERTKEAEQEAVSATKKFDDAAFRAANLQEKVDMREMTIRQTVQKNKELGDELSDCSAEILRLQKQVLYAESNGHQALANYKDSLQRCLDTAWGYGRHSHTTFTRALQSVLIEHETDLTLGPSVVPNER